MKTGLLDILILSALFVLAAKGASSQTSQLQITSSAFRHNQTIPKKYTCQGEDINPPLEISGIPEGTKSLVLIMDDPDAPMGTWDHWLLYDIPPVGKIEENSIPSTQSRNSFGKLDYGGPCPPSGTHRYFFKLYALDTVSSFPKMPTKKELENFIQAHLLAKTELIGLYKKKG